MNNNTVWAIVVCFLILWFCICSVIGVLAAKRGRSFWGWTLISFLVSLILISFFLIIAVELYSTSLLLIFSSLPISFAIFLIAVLVSGKTEEKRKKDIWEAEEIRQLAEHQYSLKEISKPQSTNKVSNLPNPNAKTINDLYKK